MAIRKPGKKKRATVSDREEKGKKREKEGRGSSPGPDEDSSFVKKYYPIFENLILFIVNRDRWRRNFASYLKDEFNRRARFLIQGLFLFVCITTFMVGSITMLVIGAFSLFNKITGSTAISAFIVGGTALVIALFLSVFMVLNFRKVLDSNKREQKDRESS